MYNHEKHVYTGGYPRTYPGTGSSSSPPGTSTNLTSQQLIQLKSQIEAYRMLSSQQPLPPEILVAVQGRGRRQEPGPAPAVAQPGTVPTFAPCPITITPAPPSSSGGSVASSGAAPPTSSSTAAPPTTVSKPSQAASTPAITAATVTPLTSSGTAAPPTATPSTTVSKPGQAAPARTPSGRLSAKPARVKITGATDKIRSLDNDPAVQVTPPHNTINLEPPSASEVVEVAGLSYSGDSYKQVWPEPVIGGLWNQDLMFIGSSEPPARQKTPRVPRSSGTVIDPERFLDLNFVGGSKSQGENLRAKGPRILAPRPYQPGRGVKTLEPVTQPPSPTAPSASMEADKEKGQQRVERLTAGMFASRDMAPTSGPRLEGLTQVTPGTAELEDRFVAVVSAAHERQVRSKLTSWYKPGFTVSEAVSELQSQAPGTFIVRDSQSVGGARELAVRVSGSGDQRKLVKHFLIQPTSRGVKMKGYKEEPVFASLSAFVYQHTVTRLGLPTLLLLPGLNLGPQHERTAQATQQTGARLTSGMFPGSDNFSEESVEDQTVEESEDEGDERVTIGFKRKTRRQLRDQRERMFEDQKKARAKESKMRETEVTRIKSIRKELMSEEEKAREKEEEKAAKKVCRTCGATNFKTRKAYWDHTRCHKKFTCDLCMTTMSVKSRPHHMKICPGQPAVRNHACDECEYTTDQIGNLQKHILRMHSEDDSHKVHKCTHDSCNYATDDITK